ncbi:MAG: DoxX family protein [Verrucomicrobiaceae bacterium]|nr:MAG: DoxX family protein [Verrucomicrobiaceae bacterium]
MNRITGEMTTAASLKKQSLVRTVLCWLCAAVFGLAAWGKLRDPLAFADSIADYRLMAWGPGITLLALGLPVFEMLLALLLVTGRWNRAAVLGMTGLTLIFTVALISAAARGLNIDCGCSGGGWLPALSIPWAIVRNTLLLGAGAWLIDSTKKLDN